MISSEQINTEQENHVNTLPVRKPGQLSSRRPLQDILIEVQPVQEVVAPTEEQPENTYLEFDLYSARHVPDDYRDILCPSEQTRLYKHIVNRCQTPPPKINIDFDFKLI